MNDTVTDNNRITRSIKQREQLEGYEQKFVPEHPYCTNWPVNKEFPVDRFDLEEQIQNVWQTKEDLEAIIERLTDDTYDGEHLPSCSMSEDEISNVLIGLSELHETRMWKLWKVFETIVHEKGFKDE